MIALTKPEWSVIGGLLILLFTTKRAKADVTGSVDAGVPFVQGPGADRFGQTDYGVTPPESEMERLIRESNELGPNVMRDGRMGLASTDDLL